MEINAIAKCSAGHVIKGTWGEDVRGGWLRCGCGRQAVAKTFAPVLNDKPCGARCTGATGPACSCSCGGENHGGGRAFLA